MRCLSFAVLFPLLALGCDRSSITATKTDAATRDMRPDAETDAADVSHSNGLDSADVFAADALSSGKDQAAAKDTSTARDTVYAPDVAADVAGDSGMAKEVLVSPDDATDGSSPPLPPDAADGKAKADDLAGGLAVDAPPLPKDVVIYTNKDLPSADAQCAAATAAWLGVVATFLAEDQRCWSDNDCTYVSFSDSCGAICVLPMNRQRIGEFGSQVYGYASANCSTCPSPSASPACPAPKAVYCNANRCEYRPD